MQTNTETDTLLGNAALCHLCHVDFSMATSEADSMFNYLMLNYPPQ